MEGYIKKEFKYRGKTMEELKTLDVREFATLLTSMQRRNVLRGFQELEEFLKRAKKKHSDGKIVKTHKRALVIVPQMIGMRIGVYNGRLFTPVDIIPEMLGHKLGEFSPTRVRAKHTSGGGGKKKALK